MTFDKLKVSGQLQGDINVTPMIDVMLVLLIIFMVISPAIPRGLDAALPQWPVNPIQSFDTPIVVQITSTRDGRLSYKLNEDTVSIGDLSGRLSAVFSLRAQKVLCIKGGDNLDFSAVARVMDIGKGAGANHIGLLTSKHGL